jgi:hypothetical protein
MENIRWTNLVVKEVRTEVRVGKKVETFFQLTVQGQAIEKDANNRVVNSYQSPFLTLYGLRTHQLTALLQNLTILNFRVDHPEDLHLPSSSSEEFRTGNSREREGTR